MGDLRCRVTSLAPWIADEKGIKTVQIAKIREECEVLQLLTSEIHPEQRYLASMSFYSYSLRIQIKVLLYRQQAAPINIYSVAIEMLAV